ncbi:MAG: adenosine kinase, partial [Nanoarchaeota archaeon]
KKQGETSRIGTNQEKLNGHALTFITPDTQRTLSEHLGAALHLQKEEVLEEDIKESKVLHLEGYQLEGDTKEVLLRAMELAKKHDTLVSLDLADPGVIRRNKEFLIKIVKEFVNILFVNEKEAKEFTGKEEEFAAIELGHSVKIAIVKIGERGSIIAEEEGIHYVEPFSAQAIDTTGAGDTYAAGFLYGFCQGWPLPQCGKLGSLFASKVVEQKGVRISHLNAEELKSRVELDIR